MGLTGRILAVFAIVTLGSAATVLAQQVNSNRLQQRYDNNRRGKDLRDWVQRLRDEDPAKRLEAVKLIATAADDPQAVEYLIEAAADPEESVKIKAIDSLGKMRATGATQFLVQQLFLRDVEPAVKQRILVALGRMGDLKAVQPITEFLAHSPDPKCSGTAVFTLGEIGDQTAVAALEDLRRDTTDPQLHRLAGEAIAKINRRMNPATVAVTVPALEEDEPPAGP